LRILHILNDITTAGNGIVNASVDIAWGQARSGHNVAVASAGGGYEELLVSSGITHYRLSQRRTPLSLVLACLRLHRIVREFHPDVVHCHMVTGSVLARLLRTFNSYRLVSHIHNVHQRSSCLMRLADLVIASSDGVAISMSSQGVPHCKMRVVRYRTLGSPRLPAFDSYNPAELQQPAIVTVAGMYKRKGITTLLKAFELVAHDFPAAHLYLVGDGPDRAAFESQAAVSPDPGRIHFEGFQRNPQTYMRSSAIFVLASYRESFGLVLLEARQAGAAIVASDVDGIPEALDHGAAGILCAPGDVESLANAMRRLLSDPVVYRYWKDAASKNLSKFEVGHMVEQVHAVYREALEGSNARRTIASARVS
jgi:glycosyltransferase involved in cell wall biosynthesis